MMNANSLHRNPESLSYRYLDPYCKDAQARFRLPGANYQNSVLYVASAIVCKPRCGASMQTSKEVEVEVEPSHAQIFHNLLITECSVNYMEFAVMKLIWRFPSESWRALTDWSCLHMSSGQFCLQARRTWILHEGFSRAMIEEYLCSNPVSILNVAALSRILSAAHIDSSANPHKRLGGLQPVS